jgi:hypothetical protein
VNVLFDGPFAELFRPAATTKQFSHLMKPLSVLKQNAGNRGWLSRRQRDGQWPTGKTGDSQMRTFSFILAFAFILAGPTLAGSSDNDLPGIGTFAYNGSPIVATAPQAIVVAAR